MQVTPDERTAAVLLTDLISRAPVTIHPLSEGRAHAEAMRVTCPAVESDTPPGAPALIVVGMDWVRALTSRHHPHEHLRRLRDDGCVGIVFSP